MAQIKLFWVAFIYAFRILFLCSCYLFAVVYFVLLAIFLFRCIKRSFDSPERAFKLSEGEANDSKN